MSDAPVAQEHKPDHRVCKTLVPYHITGRTHKHRRQLFLIPPLSSDDKYSDPSGLVQAWQVYMHITASSQSHVPIQSTQLWHIHRAWTYKQQVPPHPQTFYTIQPLQWYHIITLVSSNITEAEGQGTTRAKYWKVISLPMCTAKTPVMYSHFTISSSNCTLHTAPARVINVVGIAVSHAKCHRYSRETHRSNAFITWVIAVCNVQSGLEIVKWLYLQCHMCLKANWHRWSSLSTKSD